MSLGNVQQEIRKLNRRILSQIENELMVLKEQHTELADEVDAMFKRLRKNVLDTIGDCERNTSDPKGG